MIERGELHEAKRDRGEAPLAGIVLAAGKGTRMHSDRAKVLHRIAGVPMVRYPVVVLKHLGADPVVVVVGHQAREVEEALGDVPGIVFVRQEQPLGTAHAVRQAVPVLGEFPGPVLVLSGDVPLVRTGDLERLIRFHRAGASRLTVVSTELPDPRGYGRIVRGPEGIVTAIVEELDTDERTRTIKEINAGIYLADGTFLFALADQVRENTRKREYYLTDVISLAAERGEAARAFFLEDFRSVLGVNTRPELEQAERILRDRTGAEEISPVGPG